MKLYKQQSGLRKNLKTAEELSEDITQFENKLNADMLLNQNKCKSCKVEMQIVSPTAVECPKCGLADTKLLMKDYHKFTNSYLEPSKQTFDHEKHFATWINNILGINKPKEDIMPILWNTIEQNNIESLSLTLKRF